MNIPTVGQRYKVTGDLSSFLDDVREGDEISIISILDNGVRIKSSENSYSYVIFTLEHFKKNILSNLSLQGRK